MHLATRKLGDLLVLEVKKNKMLFGVCEKDNFVDMISGRIGILHNKSV